MADRLAARSRQHGYATSRFESRAQNARRQATTICEVLLSQSFCQLLLEVHCSRMPRPDPRRTPSSSV
jgi:hypothetical protein